MILKELKINTFIGEPTNCYIIYDQESKETMCIDPAGDVEKIEYMIKEILKGNLKYIYLTHCHGDHISALKQVRDAKGGTILIHRYDVEGLYNQNISLTDYIGINHIQIEADSRVDDGDLLHVGDIELKVIHTPGHTKGGSSLYCEKEKCIFTGDTIFRGTWGRTDLPTSSLEDIMNSITKKILVLPDDTIIYPGHGKSTIVYEEKPIYFDLKPRID